MDSFHKFYLLYMGADHVLIEEGKRVFPSITRMEPESHLSRTYHHLIASKYQGRLIHSVAPSLFPDYREVAPTEITDHLTEEVDDAFASIYSGKYYRIREMHRYTVSTPFDPSPVVTVLAEEHRDIILRRLGRRGDRVRESFWQGASRQMISEGRLFAVLENGEEIARSNVTDLPYNGANIDIWTHPDHRGKGYAKALIGHGVNWCLSNKRIPIYLVHSGNQPSINLAENLGFRRMATEIQTVVVRY